MALTPNIKDTLLNLSIKTDFGVVANYTKKEISDALEDAWYEDFRIIEKNIEQTLKNLSEHAIPGALRVVMQVQSTIRDIKATLWKSNELVLFSEKKDINALVTNPKSNMPALVQADTSTMTSWFNTWLKVIRAFNSGNAAEDGRKNSKEAIAFTGHFRREYDETYRELSLQERFTKAYDVVFGETWILLTKTHNLQYWDVIDFNNPIYAIVLLTASNTDELELLEAVRDEVVTEKNNWRFDKTLFLQRCEDDLFWIMWSISALDVLSVIIPEKVVKQWVNEDWESIWQVLVDVVNISENQKKWIFDKVWFNKRTFNKPHNGKQLTQWNKATNTTVEEYIPDL